MQTKKIDYKTGFDGQKLYNLRMASGYSMEDVADFIGYDKSSISLWENGSRRPQPRSLRKIAHLFKVPISAFFILLLLATGKVTPAYASHISDKDAIRTIVGEAANQPMKYGDTIGFDGMTAVAEVIRRRDSVKGFCGFRAMDHRSEPSWVWVRAAQAWERSATSNLTHGATLFENIKAFGFPKSWDKSKIFLTYQVGDHWFFVETK